MPTQPIPRTKRRLSEDEVRAWEAFLRAYAATSHALERVSETRGGLPLGEHFLLVQVARAPQTGIRPTDLAARSLLTKSGLTRALERLERDGLITHGVCPSDKRSYFVLLTPKGRHLLRRSAPSHIRAIAEHFAEPLSGDELQVVTAAMERIAGTGG